ncbi:hypothetical protein [uncultured Enterovirga sp.]|uniref:hypothetical protein n=1 Tax=uncultured Enterovirga sp. TaxID=2026352 RepID=UPI0035C97EC6
MAALVATGWGGSVAAQGGPSPPDQGAALDGQVSASESTLPGAGMRVTYRTFRKVLTRARCATGETLLSAFCPPDSQPILLDDAEAPGGKSATCRTGPFTLVCAR